MNFIQELMQTNEIETNYILNELLEYVDNPDNIPESIRINKNLDKTILSIANLIDECYSDDNYWTKYAKQLLKNHTFNFGKNRIESSFKTSFEVLFYAICILARENLDSSAIHSYIKNIVLRYDEFENAILELIQDKTEYLAPDDSDDSNMYEREYSDDDVYSMILPDHSINQKRLAQSK